jgi:predicted dehydrogenase
LSKQGFSVAILGCGNFGALSDLASKRKDVAFTHLKAYQVSKGFKVIGCVDKDPNKLRRIRSFCKNIKIFNSYKSMFDDVLPDIVSIVTPDDTHEEILYNIAKYPVKLVFCEKPLGLSYKAALAINNLYVTKKIPIQVNYSRRFIKEFERLKKQISNNEFGMIKKVVVHYNKGLFHNASHYVDLLLYFFGKPCKVKTISSIKGYGKDDDTVNGILSYRYPHKFDVVLLGHDVYPVSFSEVDFFFEKGRVRLINGGAIIEYYAVKSDRGSKGSGQLCLIKSIMTEHPAKKIINAVKNIRDHLVEGIPLKSSATCSLEVIKICEELAVQSRKEGADA